MKKVQRFALVVVILSMVGVSFAEVGGHKLPSGGFYAPTTTVAK
jgi:hypothetical protein